MSRIELADEVAEDFDRIVSHLELHEVENIAQRMRQIMEAISILELNPLIGRPCKSDLRELVIGRGSRGYVALYRFLPEIDTVFVLGVRGQREAGY